jgi:hypothetical protein
MVVSLPPMMKLMQCFKSSIRVSAIFRNSTITLKYIGAIYTIDIIVIVSLTIVSEYLYQETKEILSSLAFEIFINQSNFRK